MKGWQIAAVLVPLLAPLAHRLLYGPGEWLSHRAWERLPNGFWRKVLLAELSPSGRRRQKIRERSRAPSKPLKRIAPSVSEVVTKRRTV